MAAIFNFCYNVLNRGHRKHKVRAVYGGAVWRTSLKINYFHWHSPDCACILWRFDGGTGLLSAFSFYCAATRTSTFSSAG